MVLVVATMGFRSGVIVGLGIPVSLLFAVIVIYQLGYTFNFMVMFGMLLGLGMLIDGGIVVTEYADRMMADGMHPKGRLCRGCAAHVLAGHGVHRDDIGRVFTAGFSGPACREVYGIPAGDGVYRAHRLAAVRAVIRPVVLGAVRPAVTHRSKVAQVMPAGNRRSHRCRRPPDSARVFHPVCARPFWALAIIGSLLLSVSSGPTASSAGRDIFPTRTPVPPGLGTGPRETFPPDQ